MTSVRHVNGYGPLTVFALLAFLTLGFVQSDAAPDEAEVGAPAPEFTLKATDGETYALSDLAGSYVVLEWLNFGCPYVGKHYDSGNMQRLQREAAEKDVVWFSVVSSAPGEQGHYPPEEMNEHSEKTSLYLGGLDKLSSVRKTVSQRITQQR